MEGRRLFAAALFAALWIGLSSPLLAQTVDVRHIIPAFDPRLDVVRAPAGFGTGAVWQVGPDRQYKKPGDVVALVHDGDIVEIDAAHYACDTSLKWRANDLTLVGVGGRPVIDAAHCEIAGDKGIWNPQGKGLVVANIEFTGASGPSANDAAIRFDGSGYVLLTNLYIHDNQEGVLATPSDGAATDIVIDRSDFGSNGSGDGYTHNIYVSAASAHPVNSFVIRFSYSHEARVGHEVKSRALTNYILYNRLADEAAGTSSYDIDVPQGGLTFIVGNIIQHGAHAENDAMVSYSSESPHNPVQEIYVANNTFVSEIPDGKGVALNLYDNGLAAARMIDNLVVGVPPGGLIGYNPGKIDLSHNDITDAPGFFDQANRNYHLTAQSPAVGAGIDAGSAHGVALTPVHEFSFPAEGLPRSAARDLGAYEYRAGETQVPPPSVSFSANGPVDYDKPVTLTWSASDALYCGASGDWSGSLKTSGRYTSPPLTSRKNYGISCTGAGGGASRSLEVAVHQSPAAAALGAYAWRDIPGSALEGVCASNIKDSSGAFVYQDDFGTGPFCESKGDAGTGIYVPDTKTWYLLGGNVGRNYYGNEVYGFDVAALKPLLVTVPDHIADTTEYVPSDEYGSKVHQPGCNSILHLKAGGVIRAPSAIVGTAAWNPLTKEIVVGPGDYARGAKGCASPEPGQMTTDLWGFVPPAPSSVPAASASQWRLLAPDNNAFGSTSVPLWLFDPATGIAYVAGSRAAPDRGGFLIDFAYVPPRSVLVNDAWPYGADIFGPSVVDTDRHYAMVVANGAIAMWNLNGLSMTKYGPKAPFTHEAGWTVTGNRDLLSDPHHPALTYNPKLKAVVAWTGSSTVYFLYPDYRAKTINIVAKTDIAGGPEDTRNELDGKFVYLPDRDAYLAFTGIEQDFHFLVPPAKP